MNRIPFAGLLGGLMVVLGVVGVVAITAGSFGLALPEGTPTFHVKTITVTSTVPAPPSTATATHAPRAKTPAPAPTASIPGSNPGPGTQPPSATAPASAATPAPLVATAERQSGASPTQTVRTTPGLASSPAPTADAGLVIGYSVEGRELVAHRIGDGPIKAVLIGDIHGAFEANTHVLVEQLLAHFRGHPDEVPGRVSLWVIPTMNPDGLAMGHRWNANDVDLNRNADTDLDGCAGNDWSPDTVGNEGPHPGAGGPFPFSEPEIQAVRAFLEDAWIVVSYHSAAAAIYADSCQHHAATGRLARVLSEGTGYPLPKDGWSGYPITGDLTDYLAGEGVAAATVELTDHQEPEFERNLAGVQALLASVDEILSAEATEVGAELVWLDEQNTGQWSYAAESYVHPLALEVLGDTAYLLDGGRVLALDLLQPASPRLLLAPGDAVEGVTVLEPLDLASDGGALLALDRAGDVYGFDPAAQAWTLVRYDRPSGTTYDHYYVALSASEDSASYLLESSHEQVVRFEPGQKGAAWLQLSLSRDVDLSAVGDRVYVLTRALNNPRGSLQLFLKGRRVAGFQPTVEIMHPRQVQATGATVYVLDYAGRRILSLDPDTGRLLALHQFSDRRSVSAIWADPAGTGLILAGEGGVPSILHFYGKPEHQATIDSGLVLEGPQADDLRSLEVLRGLQMPVKGARVTSRDFQMPGAPRHYRLGVHEGIDVYGNTAGVTIDRSTKVQAVAGGTVIRALTEYQPLTASRASAWEARSRSLGYTPPDVLDGYRGRQVWIDHGDGFVSRYAHLGSIAPGIVEGTQVSQGQVIGTVGNSGTPSSVGSQTLELHLHVELWVNDHYVGQFLRPIETRELLERMLR